MGEGIDGDDAGNVPPDIEAVKEFEAAVAAADGSKDPGSVNVLPSGIVFGMCVGELFFGVELRPSFLEKVLVRLVFSGCADTGGESMAG